MATFHLSQVDRTDLIKILKKLNDVTFCKAVQTCSGVNYVATAMEKKTRIQSNGFLGLFLYYDEQKKQLMYDVPFNFGKKPESFDSLTFEEPHQDHGEAKQVKLEVKKMNIHKKNSCIVVCVSRRRRSFYKEMSPIEIQGLVNNFRFEEFNIITASRSNTAEVLTEIVKLSHVVKANTLDLAYSEAEAMLEEILKKNKSFNALSWSGGFGASAEGTADTWTKFRCISVGLRNPDLYDGVMQRIIKGWEAGTSKLKNISCIVNGISQGVRKFGMKPFLQVNQNNELHYIATTNSSSKALFALYSERNFSFHFDDFTDCPEGCNCTTPFCLTKLVEILKKHCGRDFPEKMDLPKLVEQWNGDDLAAFGAIILGEMENLREKNNNIPPVN